MGFLIFSTLLILLVLYSAYKSFSILKTSIAVVGLFVLWMLVLSPPSWLAAIVALILGGALFLLNNSTLRQKYFTSSLLQKASLVMPKVSETEQQALDAGTIWWDAEIWSGKPDWDTILTYPEYKLTEEEQQFLDGPVEEFCRRIDDWQITHELLDLPEELWQFLKDNKFFGMIIPKEYGGLGFSASGHSAVVTKVASRSIPAAVTVMVPNSLGPAELLLHYGSQQQKMHYLPRLAAGQEIPCFGLTGPEAGSDASSTPDRGVICKGDYDGKETTGIRLTFNKRYITLAPIATLIGVAFKLQDPDHLMGQQTDLGITFALIPRAISGIEVGNRHFPLNCPFQNGPIRGQDIFIPLSMVIGEEDGLGKGWSMLMEALAAGRGISLPALSAGGAKLASRAMGAYAAARKQFGVAIKKFEGVEEALTRIAGNTYIIDSARAITLAGIDNDERPAVVTGIVKYNLTELMRSTINDAMDVHGGGGICLGPRNLLGRTYQSIPIGITVEGANILTRSFIVFNQSLLRCHPFIRQEIAAIKSGNGKEFDSSIMGHLGFLLGNVARVLFGDIGGKSRLSQSAAPEVKRYIHLVNRLCAVFALVGDVAMLVLGADLKRKEKVTGRLSDVISHLFLTISVIKHYQGQGENKADIPLLDWACQKNLYLAQERLFSLLNNFPIKQLGLALRFLAFPFGRLLAEPDDYLGKKVAAVITSSNQSRDRLTGGIYMPGGDKEQLAMLDRFLELLLQTEGAEKILNDGMKKGELNSGSILNAIKEAEQKELLSSEQASLLMKLEEYRQEIIRVDDFATL